MHRAGASPQSLKYCPVSLIFANSARLRGGYSLAHTEGAVISRDVTGIELGHQPLGKVGTVTPNDAEEESETVLQPFAKHLDRGGTQRPAS